MKRATICVAFCLWLALPLLAQAPETIAKIHLVKVKPGMEAQFETAYKAHLAWHRENKDPWAWEAWQYQSGDRVGQYVVITPGRKWEDYDQRGEMGAKDEAHAQMYLRPLMESLEVWWSTTEVNMSRIPEGGFQNMDVKLARVTEYRIKPGKDVEFVQLIRKAKIIFEKANWGGPVLWTRNVTGDTGVFSAVQMMSSWSDLTPPEESVGQLLAREVGEEEAAAMGRTFWSCIESAEVHILTYRKDLSYAPEGM